MKCQGCGSESVIWRDAVVVEESGPEATIVLTRTTKRGTIQKSFCEGCALPLLRKGWQGETCSLSHKVPTEPKPIKPIIVQPSPTRCIGCRCRVPIRFGGEGIHCFQKNGSCPEWAVRLGLLLSGRKTFTNDEELLEALRL